MTQQLNIRVPATMANLGPGFDSFGLAVSLYNHFSFKEGQWDELAFSPKSSVDNAGLSTDPADSILFEAVGRVYKKLGSARPHLHIEMEVHVPVTRGLGSSSTAIIASMMAANRLAGDPLDQQALLDLAIEMESHPDNVAPALLGGAVLYDTKPYRLPWPKEWKILAVVPGYSLLTEDARKALPSAITMPEAIFNLRKASLLTWALMNGDEDAFRLSLEDRLHQPYRQRLITEFPTLQQLASEAGALGTIISGSGSTMAVFYKAKIEAGLLKAIEGLSGPLQVIRLETDEQGASFL